MIPRRITYLAALAPALLAGLLLAAAPAAADEITTQFGPPPGNRLPLNGLPPSGGHA